MELATLKLTPNKAGLDGIIDSDIHLPAGTLVYVRREGDGYTLLAMTTLSKATSREALSAILENIRR